MPDLCPVTICAPGAGLGHLTRACAIAGPLEQQSVPVEILTSSPYATYLARQTGCRITCLGSRAWDTEIKIALPSRSRIVILDSFPFGLRGEWSASPIPGTVIYLARRLIWEQYLQRLQLDATAPSFSMTTIMLESLEPEHEKWIRTYSQDVFTLSSPISLDASSIPVPGDLNRATLQQQTLIVHNGPEQEVQRLVQHAQASGPTSLVLVALREHEEIPLPSIRFFPASVLFPHVRHIMSGAGYNIMAETIPYRDKHTAIPFERHYDDQAARLGQPWAHTANGATEAAGYIADIL